MAPLSAAGSDSDNTEIVDLSGAGAGAGQRAGAGAGRPRTAFQALNSRFSLVLAELRQVHLRTMKPASLPPLLDTGHMGDRWILYISTVLCIVDYLLLLLDLVTKITGLMAWIFQEVISIITL